MIETGFARALIAGVLCSAAISAAAQGTDDLEGLRRQALDLVNADRVEAGLPELSLGPVLNEAAQGHATDMAERDYYAHVGPDGETPRDRFRSAGGSRWALSGENIAKCTGCATPPDAERVDAFHSGWMQSPGHRDNILTEGFDRFGFGIAGDADEIYAVQTFAGPGGEADAEALSDPEARRAALDEANAHRDTAGLGPIKASDPLDAMAERVLEIRMAGDDLPEDTFGLLPEGSTGWTSLSVLSASRGGGGSVLTGEVVASVVEDWADGRTDAVLGGAQATHLGFAAEARSDGRVTAIAILGGRD